jgi:hypothetical protein
VVASIAPQALADHARAWYRTTEPYLPA